MRQRLPSWMSPTRWLRLPAWVRLPSWMSPSPRMRVAAGMTAVVTSVMLILSMTNLVPDASDAHADARARLTELVALSAYGLSDSKGLDHDALEFVLTELQSREPSLLSAAIRRADGEVTLTIGDHGPWTLRTGEKSTREQVQVPLFADEQGTIANNIELRFTPLKETGVIGFFKDQKVRFLFAVGGVTFILFWLITGRMLKVTESGRAVPSRVRSALDTLAEGLLVIDNRGEIVLANSTFADLLGQDAATISGMRADMLPWEPVEQNNVLDFEFPWTIAYREERIVSNTMLQMEKSPTDIRIFVVNCSPVMGSEGSSRGVLASFEDVTLLEQKKQELAKSREEAVAANEAKSSFLANMSHEIRTPMNAILGFADVLRRGLAGTDEERSRYLDTIHSSGKHLLNLINDILDLSKVEAGKLDVEITDCPVHQILAETVQVLGVKANEKGIYLRYESDGPVPAHIQSDPTRLRQIVTNLTGNAIKFTEEGGVTLTSRVVGSGITAQLQIDVADTGIGMSPEVCGKIFQPFVQADSSTTRKFGGTGLGLSISKNFSEALGGGLNVSSEPGKGSKFTAVLPISGADPKSDWLTADQFNADRKTAKSSGDTRLWRLPERKILVVDDGDANRKLLQLVLGKAGLRVEVAENGREAVDKIQAAHDASDSFDLVFMDMQMPVLDGYSATQEVRSKGDNTPIVALTGNAMKGDEQKCMDAGCTGFLSKPVDLDQLLRTTAEILQVTATIADPNEAAAVSKPAIRPSEPQSAAATARETIRRTASLPPIRSTLLEDGDAEFIDIVAGFVDKLGPQLALMKEKASGRNFKELAELAHWLKGAGGTMGFAEFTAPARQLEGVAKAGDKETAELLIAGLQTLHDRIELPAIS